MSKLSLVHLSFDPSTLVGSPHWLLEMRLTEQLTTTPEPTAVKLCGVPGATCAVGCPLSDGDGDGAPSSISKVIMPT